MLCRTNVGVFSGVEGYCTGFPGKQPSVQLGINTYIFNETAQKPGMWSRTAFAAHYYFLFHAALDIVALLRAYCRGLRCGTGVHRIQPLEQSLEAVF